jgi:hypothetical protein
MPKRLLSLEFPFIVFLDSLNLNEHKNCMKTHLLRPLPVVVLPY